MPVDPCFAELLADKRNELRPPPPHITIDVMRAANKAFLVAVPKTPVHSIEDVSIEGPKGPLALRIYRPSAARDLPAILFCHGGGFVLGDLDSHDSMCQRLAHSAACVVVAVGYRCAPESTFPEPVEECHAALTWLVTNAEALGVDSDRVALCGDSAGANLAAATAVLAKSRGPAVRHLALFYPMVDPACDSKSMQDYARGYLLAASAVQWSWGLYLGKPADADDPLACLLRADPAAFPPTTIVTAEFDPLRDEGEALARHIQAAGVQVVLRNYAGMVHGFAGLPQLTPLADRAIDEIAADITAAFARR